MKAATVLEREIVETREDGRLTDGNDEALKMSFVKVLPFLIFFVLFSEAR